MALTPQMAQMVLDLARQSIRHRLGEPEIPGPNSQIFAQLALPAGCFVSLHRSDTHALRGCIGILQTDQPLMDTLRGAADGVLKDPRFVHQPVTLAEIPDLQVEVTVIHPLQEAKTPLDFDPLEQGIYLTLSGRGGCFLPQVARETGWTREQLLSRLCTEKLGLNADAWRNPSAKLQTFSAEVLGPVDL